MPHRNTLINTVHNNNNSTDILVKRFTPLDIKGCVSRMHCKNIMNIYLGIGIWHDLNFFSKTSNEVYMG